MRLRSKVAIVGGGPVGLMLAIELGLRRIPTIVIDRKSGTTDYPKANTHSARSMEHYRRVGIARELRAAGLPAWYPTDIGYFTRLARHELARVVLPSVAQAMSATDDLTPEPPHRASQLFLEPIMVRRVAKLPSVKLFWNYRADSIDAAGPAATIRGENTRGEPFRIDADFVVGCDGPRSLVRSAMGADYVGEYGEFRPFMGGKMFSIHFRMPHFYGVIPHKACWQYWTINKSLRSITVAIDGNNEFLFHTQISEDVSPGQAEAQRMLASAFDLTTQVEIISTSFWRAGQGLVSNSFRRDNLFIAGDAAHLFTPTGGFGLNTGIDDVANLGWKLAATVQGWGGEALLRSYHDERHPVGIRNTNAALNLARSAGACPVPDEIEAPGAAGDVARRITAEYLDHVAYREFRTLGVQLGARYRGSSIVIDDGRPLPEDDPVTYVPSACPGARAPHLWMGRNRALFDCLGDGFTLLDWSGNDSATKWIDDARETGAPIERFSLDQSKGRDLYGADYVIVRPDQHVAWRGNRLAGEAVKTLRILSGQEAGIVIRENLAESVK